MEPKAKWINLNHHMPGHEAWSARVGPYELVVHKLDPAIDRAWADDMPPGMVEFGPADFGSVEICPWNYDFNVAEGYVFHTTLQIAKPIAEMKMMAEAELARRLALVAETMQGEALEPIAMNWSPEVRRSRFRDIAKDYQALAESVGKDN